MYPPARRQPRNAATVLTIKAAAKSGPSCGFGDPGIGHDGDERDVVAEVGGDRVGV